MSDKYHIKPDGTPGKCTAKEGNCPYGGADAHYDSKQAAYEAFQKKMEQNNSVTEKVSMFTEEQFANLRFHVNFEYSMDENKFNAEILKTNGEYKNVDSRLKRILFDGKILSSNKEYTPEKAFDEIYQNVKAKQPAKKNESKLDFDVFVHDVIKHTAANSGSGEFYYSQMEQKGINKGVARAIKGAINDLGGANKLHLQKAAYEIYMNDIEVHDYEHNASKEIKDRAWESVWDTVRETAQKTPHEWY
jgi:hypothetical protein